MKSIKVFHFSIISFLWDTSRSFLFSMEWCWWWWVRGNEQSWISIHRDRKHTYWKYAMLDERENRIVCFSFIFLWFFSCTCSGRSEESKHKIISSRNKILEFYKGAEFLLIFLCSTKKNLKISSSSSSCSWDHSLLIIISNKLKFDMHKKKMNRAERILILFLNHFSPWYYR